MVEHKQAPPEPSAEEFDSERAEIDSELSFRASFSEALTSQGFSDTLVLARERADAVFSDRRLRIIDYLDAEEVESVRALARELGEDKGVVSRDLEALAQLDVVEYVENGRAKAPRLKHTHVVVEPIV
ncbi:HVO_A0114 family putative DNA-binding protein [Halobellus marinus]|uniref:HVO_A0114 family putative DNA-binding protein n=1 Tax=Halobellus sp. GCM10025813 TaxID=3252665 RepID=UPI0036159338